MVNGTLPVFSLPGSLLQKAAKGSWWGWQAEPLLGAGHRHT